MMPPCKRRGKCLPLIAVLLAIGFTLSASIGSWAQEPCTTGTLQGQYVFTGRGFIEAVEPGVQRVHYGVFVFDGAGKFSGKQSSSRGGKIGREKLQGTYTLDADCTGTMTFGSILNYGQIHWDLYVTEDHKRGYLIRMDDDVTCKTCGKRFEIPSHQSMVFVGDQPARAGRPDDDDDNRGNRA